MKKAKINELLILAVITAIVVSCSNSKKFVSNGVITKRKYNNGYFLSLNSKKGKVNVNKTPNNFIGGIETNYIEYASNLDKKSFLIEASKNENLKNAPLTFQNHTPITKFHILPTAGTKTTKVNSDLSTNQKSDKVSIKYFINASSGGGKKGLSIASLVLGILSILTCWLPYIGLILGVTGIVLGVLGLKKENAKGLSIAGIVCSVVGTILGLWPLIFAAALLTL